MTTCAVDKQQVKAGLVLHVSHVRAHTHTHTHKLEEELVLEVLPVKVM